MIETLDTKLFSGSNRTVIGDTNLEAPVGLALDLKRHRLFWCDSALTTLNSVNFDGADRHSLMESESRKWLSKPMGVTFFEGHLYWIDVTFNGGSISKVSTVQTDRAPELLADHLTDIYDLKIYSSRAQKGKLYTSLALYYAFLFMEKNKMRCSRYSLTNSRFYMPITFWGNSSLN